MTSSPSDSSPPLFDLAGLGFAYGGGPEAVRDVSFQIRRGEMVGLIGPNGAGKSTLLHLMSGLFRPGRGRVLLDGEPIDRLDPRLRARSLAFVPQAASIFFPFTVAEIVAMGRHPYLSPFGGLSAEDRRRVQWAMEVTGTAPFASRSFNQLSGGEAQRVVIARAFAQDTPTLILDEPTLSLDLFYQTAIYGLLERMNHEHGLTVVVVTHEINLAAEYCPRLIGLREGRVLIDGTPEEVLTTETIDRLYGVQAEIIMRGRSRLVRVRQSGALEAPNAAREEPGRGQ